MFFGFASFVGFVNLLVVLIKYEERGTVGFNVAKGTIRGANGVYLGIYFLERVGKDYEVN